MSQTLMESFGTLVLIIAVLAGALWFVKNYARKRLSSGEGKRFRVVGRLPLEPKRSLYLVLLGDKLLVMGSSDSGLTLVKEIEDPKLISHLTDIDVGAIPMGEMRSQQDIASSTNKTASADFRNEDNMLSFAEFVKSLTKKENRS